ncbi:hypothetical protein V8C42DRAFT_211918 [Trichoderma barbatum]
MAAAYISLFTFFFLARRHGYTKNGMRARTKTRERDRGAITARQRKTKKKQRMARVNSVIVLLSFSYILYIIPLCFSREEEEIPILFCFRQKTERGNERLHLCFLGTETERQKQVDGPRDCSLTLMKSACGR